MNTIVDKVDDILGFFGNDLGLPGHAAIDAGVIIAVTFFDFGPSHFNAGIVSDFGISRNTINCENTNTVNGRGTHL